MNTKYMSDYAKSLFLDPYQEYLKINTKCYLECIKLTKLYQNYLDRFLEIYERMEREYKDKSEYRRDYFRRRHIQKKLRSIDLKLTNQVSKYYYIKENRPY
jgi:hypothetical protein